MHAYLAELDVTEMRELVSDAWLMVVPKRVGADHLACLGLAAVPDLD